MNKKIVHKVDHRKILWTICGEVRTYGVDTYVWAEVSCKECLELRK